MTKLRKKTWLKYIEETAVNENIVINDLNKFASSISFPTAFMNFFRFNVPAVYVLDYRTGKYTFVSENVPNVIGFSSKEVISNGIGLTLENYYSKDLALYDKQMFPDRLEMLKTIPPHLHKDHIFTYTFRFKDAFGNIANILQRNCYIESDEKGNPLISMGTILNIEHHVKENCITQTVEKMASSDSPAELLSSKHYYLNEEDRCFSKREKEILKYTMDGHSCKEIAAKLFIAEGTVIQHRKNMLRKSNAKNAAELVTFAVRNGYL
ncbi:MAG: helix-turn-helix transcriptional regulator [Arachidicoccus sp.]|nr:helix-turn-helix transcriptional regulator [Arachidicoccus sp.]